jgi:hypothetical protein
MKEARFYHDLRAPLVRAQSYAKLLAEASAEELNELVDQLQLALNELGQKIKEAESETPSA